VSAVLQYCSIAALQYLVFGNWLQAPDCVGYS
jgi:hypothetical protein